MKSLAEQFECRISAGVPGLLIRSHEHEDAIEEIRRVCCSPENHWQLATFDVDEGMLAFEQHESVWARVPCWFEERTENGQTLYSRKDTVQTSPVAAIRGIPGLSQGKLVDYAGEMVAPPAILVMKNHHRWLNVPNVIQLVANRLWSYKLRGCHIVFLSPVSELPIELQKLFESGHINHPLPDRQQIRAVIGRVAEESELPDDIEPVIDACSGLTRLGVEDAIALSIREKGLVDSNDVFDLKAEAFKNSSNALQLYRGSYTLDDYGGADFLKEFCLDLLSSRETNPKFRPRGVFLVGPGGVGKTHFAKCLGAAANRTTAVGRLPALKSKFQGEAQENMQRMFESLTAMSPCMVLFDEVEGQVSGGKDTGATDGGTKAELNSGLLSFMDSREDKDVFVLAAANDVRPILASMPEFLRLGRFDAMFFLDYPGRKAKDDIWKIHLRGYEWIDPEEDVEEAFARFRKDHGLPDDDEWTGAEIEACCSLARKRKHRGATVRNVGKSLATIAKRDIGTIQAIREWAESAGCYAAEYEGTYKISQHAATLSSLSSNGTVRRVRRQRPSNN